MSVNKKQKLIPFSPLYEPIIHKRYVEHLFNNGTEDIELLRRVFNESVTKQFSECNLHEIQQAAHDKLYYVTSDMVSLAVAAATEETPQVAPPSQCGFMLWEGGVSKPQQENNKNSLSIYGVHWFPADDGTIIFTYIYSNVLNNLHIKCGNDYTGMATLNILPAR